jgi:uncharacterized protein DUF2490
LAIKNQRRQPTSLLPDLEIDLPSVTGVLMPRLLITTCRIPPLPLLAVGVLLLPTVSAFAQSSSAPAEEEFWPAFTATFELGPKFHLQAIVEKRDGEGDSYVLWRTGAVFSYQALRRIKRPDADNEEEDRHYIVIGAGYEFLHTNDNGTTTREHRLIFQFTPKHSIGWGVLLQNRNRLEFVSKAQVHNLRYRDKLIVDRPFQVHNLILIPYASGELFWDRNAHAWNQNRSAFGVRLPYKKSLVFDSYYLRKNCSGCSRPHVNVIGFTVNWYFRQGKK